LYLGEAELTGKAVKRMKKLSSSTSDQKLKVWALSTEALVYFRQRKFSEAINIYEKMVKISDQNGFVNEKFIALQNIAAAYGQLGNMNKAGENFEKVYIEAKKTHNYNLLMRAVDGMSKVSYIKGDFRTAEKYIKDGIKLVEKTSKLNMKELLLNSLFNIRLEHGEYDEALKLCDEREDVLKKTNDNSGLAVLNDNRGDVYFHKKDYKKAISIYTENVKFAESIGNIEMVGHGYGNLANCYAETGDIKQSLKYYNMQLEYASEHNDIHSEGKALYNLAYTYFHDLKDVSNSEQTALKAKKVAEKIGFKDLIGRIENLLKEIEENKAKKSKH
jgi:tetratricopeptide (TPR) repeat protein